MSEVIEHLPAVVPDKTYHFNVHKQLRGIDVPSNVYVMNTIVDSDYKIDRVAHFERLIGTARPQVEEGGPPYLLVSEEGTSTDTALVLTLPYGNPVIPDVLDGEYVAEAAFHKSKKALDSNTWNNAEKLVFLYDAMRALSIRDESGDPIAVVGIGADSQDYRPKLTGEQKKELRHGSLDLYTDNASKILERNGFGNLHVGGYSQGGSVAHSFLASANNFDIAGATLAEMPTYKSRSIGQLAVNYLLDKPSPKINPDKLPAEEKWTADGPFSRRELEDIQNRAMTTMAQTIVRGAWRTAFALRHGTMIPDLNVAVGRRGVFPLTISWNETSALTHDIEEILFALGSEGRELLDYFDREGQLRTVKAVGHEAVGAPHLAGESPMYHALLFAESVQWANSK